MQIVKEGQVPNLARRILSEDFAFDTESEGPNLVGGRMLNVHKSRLVGFSFAFLGDNESYYCPVRHSSGNVSSYRRILDAVSKTATECWAHNWKHDRVVLNREGFERPENAKDSLILMWLLGKSAKSRYGLKALSKEYLGKEMRDFKEVLGKNASWSEVDPVNAAEYACEDAEAVRDLVNKYRKSGLCARGLANVFNDIEMPIVFCLSDMESVGMHLDCSSLDLLANTLQSQVDDLRDEWEFLFPDVLITSSVQVSDYFYGEGLWPTKGVDRGKSGRLSTARRFMEQALNSCKPGSMGHIAAEVRLGYQDLSKYLSTFTHTLSDQAKQYEDHRLRCSFRQHGTATGRLSCASPNLQNIPARSSIGGLIRNAFSAPEGRVMVCADYSQIELRVLAHLAGEGELADAYRNGIDIHQRTADLVGCSRQQAKTINFATVYGARAKTLSEQLGVTRRQAQSFLKGYHDAYPEVARVRDGLVSTAYEEGFARTLNGRQRPMPELIEARTRNPDTESLDHKMKRWFGERIAFNTAVQGGAADIVKRAMISFHDKMRGTSAHLVSQVHDELLVECDQKDAHEVAKELRSCMENAVELSVPLVAEPSIGQSWGECK